MIAREHDALFLCPEHRIARRMPRHGDHFQRVISYRVFPACLNRNKTVINLIQLIADCRIERLRFLHLVLRKSPGTELLRQPKRTLWCKTVL